MFVETRRPKNVVVDHRPCIGGRSPLPKPGCYHERNLITYTTKWSEGNATLKLLTIFHVTLVLNKYRLVRVSQVVK